MFFKILAPSVLGAQNRVSLFARRVGRLALFLCCLLFTSSVVQAAPGDLDVSFGTGGKSILRVSDRADSFVDATVLPDGKILVLGTDGYNGVLLVRYDANGRLDAAFGASGLIFANPGAPATPQALAVQSDGKIVVVGSVRPQPNDDAMILRFNADGSFDNTFNGNGRFVLNSTNGTDSLADVKIQPDGKIVAVGTANRGADGLADMLLLRLSADGTLDNSFDADGKVLTSVGGNTDAGIAVELLPDGKIVALGRSVTFPVSAPGSDLVLSRYLPNGALDTTFGANGLMVQDFGTNEAVLGDLAIQPDGKIVVCASIGSNISFVYTFTIFRYQPAGAPDASFGNGGSTPISNDSINAANAVFIQPDGKILACGHAEPAPGAGLKILVTRLNENGTFDANFGSGGKVFTPIGAGNLGDYGYNLTVQPDGKIIVVGDFTISLTDYDAVILRYLAANPKTTFDFDADGKADTAVFRPASGTWYLLQSSNNSFQATPFGISGDRIAPADFDGDGKTDIAVFRNGAWYVLQSATNSFRAASFGQAGDVPVAGDYDADGRADFAVFRAGDWYILNSATNSFRAARFGLATDIPFVGDFDADGRIDLSVYRDGAWYVQRSTAGFLAAQFGLSSDKIVPADYDADGKTDFAVFRPSNGTWYLLRSTTGFAAVPFGTANDRPVPADYDGDGRADIAVFRDGTWYLSRSTAGFAAVSFGTTNDAPAPAAFLP